MFWQIAGHNRTCLLPAEITIIYTEVCIHVVIILWLYPFVLWIVTKLSINMSSLPPSPLLLDVPPWLVHLAPGPVECWVSAQG